MQNIPDRPFTENLQEVEDIPDYSTLYGVEVKYAKDGIESIFDRSCGSCHGDNSHPHWLDWLTSKIIPKEWLKMERKKAQDRLNIKFGFPFVSSRAISDDLSAVKKSIVSGTMPPRFYRWSARNSKLSKIEKEKITEWIDQSLQMINTP